LEELIPEVLSVETKPPQSAPESRKAASKRKRDRIYKRNERERKKKIEEANQPQTDRTALNILRDTRWNLSNRNVIDQCVENGTERAHELNLVPSVSYWLEGSDAEHSIDVIGGRSEVLSMRDLWALYSFTARGLKVLGTEISFEDWLNLRDRARKDLYWLAETVLQIPLVEEVHRPIIDLIYPSLNADGMFTLDYKLTDMHRAINLQCETKEHMILDPRAWMKSAVASAFMCQFSLNFPECRIFSTSGTDDLAEAMLRIMKGYFGHETGGVVSTLHRLFPEYTLRRKNATSDQPIVFPNRKFYQKGYSFETFGVMSAASGRHCDLYCADDNVQSKGTEETRPKLKDKADGLMSNVPDAHAIKIVLGTRYDLQDWYSGRIELLESDPTSMKFHARGVMEILPEFVHLPYRDLKLEMVKLNWPMQFGSPEKTFKAYVRKIVTNESDFRHQQMNVPISAEDADNRVAFNMDAFSNLFIDPRTFPQEGDRYLVIDIAWSMDKRADFSVLAVGRIGKSLTSGSELSVYVEHIDAARRRSSELSLAIVELSMGFPGLKSIISENIGGVEAVMDESRRQAQLRNHTLPYIYVAKVLPTTGAKWRRIKLLELLVAQSRLWFSNQISPTQTALIHDQFGKYTGKRSSTRHDDIPDSVALMVEFTLPREDKEGKQQQEIEAAKEKAQEEQARREQYNRIFLGGGETNVSSGRAWREGMPTTGSPSVDFGDSNVTRGPFGIPGLRNWNESSQTAAKKISFGDVQPKHS
jgi:hypothetical protein